MLDQWSFVQSSQSGQLDVLERAIAAGRELDAPDSIGRTALVQACLEGHLNCVRALLDAGADPGQPESRASIAHESCTPLVAAAARGHTEILRVLLGAGVELEAQSSRYRTALAAAAEEGHEEALELLLAAGVEVDGRQGYHARTALAAAAHRARDPLMHRLLAAGADPTLHDERGDSILHVYCGAGSGPSTPEMIAGLVDAGADPNALDHEARSPLHEAARWKHPTLVEALLLAGADPSLRDAKDHTPLHEACKSRHGEALIPMLLDALDEDRRADLVRLATGEGQQCLHLACANTELGPRPLLGLLAAGADPNRPTTQGRTPLMCILGGMPSAREPALAKAHMLLERGAIPSGAVLERAARFGDARLVQNLLARSEPSLLAHRDQWQRTPLHWAAHDGHALVVLALAHAGARLDAGDQDEHTPLHLALRARKLDSTVALLHLGAGLPLNRYEHSPLHYAEPATLDALCEHFEHVAKARAREQGESRAGLRCPTRGAEAEACASCPWTATDSHALACPWCAKRAVTITDYEVLHGNPEIPTANTEVSFGYTCGHCGLGFTNGWNAMHTERPYLHEPDSGASWRSEDGGRSWKRVWGLGE